MPILDKDLELEKRRNDAKLSQVDMANFLGISQSQVSRYEQDPDNVPAGILRKWLQFCGDISASKGIDVSNPRTEIETRIKLIKDYSCVKPTLNNDLKYILNNNPTPDVFLNGIYMTARKPKVGVFGRYDAGKSSLLNALLGKNCLPTNYQATTSIVSIIRHVSNKPSWQPEDVWIMKNNFNFDNVDDEDHCLEHKLFAGGYEALTQYGTHKAQGAVKEAFAAVVYMDAPLLTCADFLDFPGYGHSDEDENRADIRHKFVDVLLYLSPCINFMNENDRLYLSTLLRKLPGASLDYFNENRLSNVYVIATHSHNAKPDAREVLLETAAVGCFNHLEKTLTYMATSGEKQISLEDFKQRFFTFSIDDPDIRKRFEGDLIKLLTGLLPQHDIRTLDKYVQTAKNRAKDSWDNEIAKLKMIINGREKAQAEYKRIMDGEPERLSKKSFEEKRINELIETFANESDSLITQIFSKHTNIPAIEAMIRRRYDNKKEAQKFAGTYLLEELQGTIEEWVRIKSNDLGKTIDNFLESYGPMKVDDCQFTDAWSFDARAAFMGALSGLSTIGALAAWAAIAAAGSNLGGYILVAQAVGWLASLGISLGGSATVISIVSALGGPITVAIGLGTIVAAGVWAIFGDSWQTKLAKKINNVFMEKHVEQQFKAGVAKYWTDTSNGFNIAIGKTEEAFQDELKYIKLKAFSINDEDLKHAYQQAEKFRDFFGGIPWKAVLALPQ